MQPAPQASEGAVTLLTLLAFRTYLPRHMQLAAQALWNAVTLRTALTLLTFTYVRSYYVAYLVTCSWLRKRCGALFQSKVSSKDKKIDFNVSIRIGYTHT